MQQQHQGRRRGYLLLFGLGTIVLAFMGLSLAITANGTARFAIAMGYRAEVGYAVGGVFDIAKALLPVALLVFAGRRAFFSCAIIGCAWLGLVTYSWLATHATVSAAIATIERNGAWKMESRTNVKAELADLEQRITTLSQPLPPRPSKGVAEALASERVPVGVWQDSQECARIRGSRYFEKACAKVLELRRELAAAQDYERIEARLGELRHALATAPIVATQDPLPRAFTATVGRLIPVDGDVGVAHLLTLVVEIMSCFGLAAVRVLGGEQRRGTGQESDRSQQSETPFESPRAIPGMVPGRPTPINTRSSLKTTSVGARPTQKERLGRPSNVVPMPTQRAEDLAPREGESRRPSAWVLRHSEVRPQVCEFVRARLQLTPGVSLGASELWAAYEKLVHGARARAAVAAEARHGADGSWVCEMEVVRSDPLQRGAARGVTRIAVERQCVAHASISGLRSSKKSVRRYAAFTRSLMV